MLFTVFLFAPRVISVLLPVCVTLSGFFPRSHFQSSIRDSRHSSPFLTKPINAARLPAVRN